MSLLVDQDLLIQLPSDVELTAQDMRLNKLIGEKLTKTFPGWAWRIDAQSHQGIVNILCANLSPTWGIVVRFSDFQDDPSMKWIVHHAGELLERFGVSTGRIDYDQIASKTRDFAGRLEVDKG